MRLVIWLGCAVVALVYTSVVRAESAMERGQYLVNSIVACSNCHTEEKLDGPNPKRPLAGTFLIEEPAFTAYGPNITPDKETGIGITTKPIEFARFVTASDLMASSSGHRCPLACTVVCRIGT